MDSWSTCSKMARSCPELIKDSGRNRRSRRRWRQLWKKTRGEKTEGLKERRTRKPKCFVLTAESQDMAWLIVQRLTEMRRWAEASATAVAQLNMKSTSAELKWIQLWVIIRLQSALSADKLDTCLAPAQIIQKDCMLKEGAVVFVVPWNIFRKIAQNIRHRQTP